MRNESDLRTGGRNLVAARGSLCTRHAVQVPDMLDSAGSEKCHKVLCDLGGLFKRDEVAGVQLDQLRIRDAAGGSPGEGLRQYVPGTVDDECWAIEIPEDCGRVMKNRVGLTPTY